MIKSQQRDMRESDELLAWLMSRIEDWRQYRDDNYKASWDEYYRLWRGIWDAQDKMRDSERSRLISPALQQAVEATVAELEEATFGRENYFDIQDDVNDENVLDVQKLRIQLKEDLDLTKTKKKICEALLNGTLYGTGIGEIIVEKHSFLTPEDQFIPGTQVIARGTSETSKVLIKLNPVSPYNFSSDPAVSDVDECLGCEVTEIIPRHQVEMGIDNGTYTLPDGEELSEAQDDHMMLPGETKLVPMDDKVKLTRYYGKVPLDLINDFHGIEQDKDKEKEDSYNLVEAIIVIANDSQIIKAEISPYMMKDRPIVAYQHDTVPGRLHGRGVCEKGYNAQKALDTELRARADALALTTHPMMGVDATRLPRGMKPKIQPGQSILTNGNPKEILMPLNFGQLNPVSYKESAELERMVTMGTGAMDMTALTMGAGQPQGQSMLMGASIKRQKRTLMNFQESFLIPLIRKAAYRFMQFDPERYPATDLKFFPTSTMGLMAREFEQQQMTTMLGYIPPDSPIAALIVKGIVENSSLQNREVLTQAIEQAAQEAQQNAQEQAQNIPQMAQIKVQSDQNDIAREKMAMDNQKNKVEMQFRAEELKLAMRKQDNDEEVTQIEAGKLALNEMKIHFNHEATMTDVNIKAANNMQDNATNAQNVVLQAMKTSHDELTKKVSLISSKPIDLAQDVQKTSTKKKINLLRDKNGTLIGAEVT